MNQPIPFDIDDLRSPVLVADPYTFFGRIRETDPVRWNPHKKAWLVTRHEDVGFITRNSEIFSSAPKQPFLKAKEYWPPIAEEAWDLVDAVDPEYRGHLGIGLGNFLIVSVDRPAHLQMRQALHEWFMPRNLERWRGLIAKTVNDLIEAHYDAHRMEFKNSFATKLSFTAIRIMLGLPEADGVLLREISERLTNPNDGTVGAVAALKELAQYMRVRIDARMTAPGDDILSMVAAGEKGGVFTRSQAESVAITLLLAGHETTLSLMTNGLHAFICNPDQWDLLRSDPDKLTQQAVEECLRYHPTLTVFNRVAVRDVEIGGKVIRARDDVYGVISSANRDPRAFKDPDKFDITRMQSKHLAFSGGIHHCLGAPLARIEASETFKALAKRFERFELEGEIEYLPDVFVHHMHQPVEMNIRW
jgi:cytochrome P450